MASVKFPMTQFALFLLLALSFQGALGGIICEELPKKFCAFSISSDGKRCLIENYPGKDGKMEYQCRTSEVVVDGLVEWIETDECVHACGADRNSIGISSDSLLEPQFAAHLCSPDCYHKCPNLVDLYFNLAAGEGVFLPDLCEAQRRNPHRAMAELMSSGEAAGPVSSESATSGSAEAPLSSSNGANTAAAPSA